MQDSLSYEHELKKILIHMGITPNYKGYEYILFAMKLIFEKPVCLQYVTKELYPEIAKKCLTDWRAVEHSIRMAIVRSWDEDPQRFQKILTVRMKYRPSTGKFLALLYTYLVLIKRGETNEGSEKNF